MPKIQTDLLWDLTMLFLGLAIVIFSTIFYFRNKLRTTSRRVQEKKKELSPMISEFIFYSNDVPIEEKHIYIKHKILIRDLLKNEFDRKVLISILLDLSKDVSGDTQKQLIHLYKNLGLHEDAYKKLKSWRWQVVAKGILELTQMQVTESYQFIVRFINNKRSVIRKQAEIATVTLKNEGISHFMDTTKYRISEWQQLVFLEVLRNNKDFEPPRFKAWLTSKNKHVVLLALRFIKHFNQNDAKASLIELLKHRNNQIKEEAIYCLREFHVVEALDTLKLVFWRCSTDIKILILGAIADLGDTKDIEFLKQIEHKRVHYLVKSKALNAINSIVPESIMPTKDIESTENIIVPEDLIKETNNKEVNDEKPEEVTCNDAIEVLEEEIESAPLEIDLPNKDEIIEEKSDVDKLEVEDLLGFLPIVVPADDKSEEIEIDVNELDVVFKEVNSPKKSEEIEVDVDLLDVIYSEIMATKKSEEEEIVEDINPLAPDLIDKDMNFLPIVVDNEVENILDKEEKLFQDILTEFELEYEEVIAQQEKVVIEEILECNQDEAEKHSHEISSFEVIYEELIVEGNVEEEEEKLIEWSDLVEDIPRDGFNKEEKLFQETLSEFDLEYEEVIAQQEKMVIEEILERNQDEEENYSHGISSIEVIYEELIIEGYVVEEEEKLIKWSDLVEDIPSDEFTKEEMEAILSIIPKPYEFDNETSELICLLSDIEELGDHREIPFLTNLLLEESRPLIQERIRDVMYSIEKVIDFGNKTVRPSVFEHLFIHADIESKLILMDELEAIGGEKEVCFLAQLVNDANSEISTEAEAALAALKERLSNENRKEMDITSFDVLNSFECSLDQRDEYEDLLTFTDEFILEYKTNEEIYHESKSFSERNMGSTFLSQLMAIPNKLLEKLNG